MKTIGLIATLSFTACTNATPEVSGISDPSITQPETPPNINVDKTVAALNSMQSVSILEDL